MRSKKLPIFIKTCSWAVAFCLATPSLHATAYTVNVAGDPNLATGGTFAGTSGSLRGVLNNINQNPGTHTVTFSLGASNTITLNAMLPILNLNAANTVTINGANGGTPIVIDGGNNFRGFFARQGTITLQNLTVQNVTATGGAGGGGGGGGGMGAGAALFIDAANVTLTSVTMNNASAVGGDGGGVTGGGSGGGGGMGGDGGSDGGGAGGFGGGGIGGSCQSAVDGGGGGGGINCGTGHTGLGGLATVTAAGATGGGIGGAKAGDADGGGVLGGASGGGGAGGSSTGGGGGGVGGVNGGPTNATGGDGGYGGGGGSPAASPDSNNVAGNGGFGGGGGGKVGGTTGGNGGFGGGGGGSGGGSSPGIGGFGGGGGRNAGGAGGAGGVGGGRGGSGDGGGGGAGFGGAIFVNQPGSLTITGALTTSANSTNFGDAGTGSAVQGWNAGNTAFFLTGAAVTLDPNGSTITISNSIGDDSAASFVGAPAGVTLGAAAGAALIVGNAANPVGTTILSAASTYSGGTTLNKGTLRVGNNTAMGGGALTFAATSGNILQSGAAGLTVANAVVLNANGSVDSNGNTFTLSGGISGASILTKIGTGTLILPNANTYSGGTHLDVGTIRVGNNTSLGTNTLTFETSSGNILQSGAAALTIANAVALNANGSVDSNGNTFTLSGVISGASILTKIGTGTLVLSNANTYSGGTHLDVGTIRVGNNTALGTNTFTFETTSGNILQSGAAGLNVANAVALNANGSVDSNGNTFTLSGDISGASILTKIGTGTLVLPNANTYSGGTHLDVGTIRVGNNTALGTNTLTFETNSGNILQSGAVALNVANAVVLNANGSVDSNGNTFTLSGGISGASILTKIGTGTLVLPNANTYSGGTHLDLGTINVGNNTALGTNTLTFETTSDNILQAGAAALNVANSIVLTTNGSIDSNGNTFTLSGGISGASILTKIGTGALVLPNANTYSGGTHLDLGTISVGNNTALGTNTLTFETNSGNILQSGAAGLTLSNPVVLNADGSIDSNGNTFTLSGNISGGSALAKQGAGTAVLSGTNTYGGGTDVSAGILQINTAASFPSGGNLNLSGAGAEFDVSPVAGTVTIGDLTGVSTSLVNLGTSNLVFGTATPMVTYAGDISGTSSFLTKQGSGTAVLSGNNSYTGLTTVSAGTLQISSTTALPSGGNVDTAAAGATLDLTGAGSPVTIGDLTGVAGSLVNLGTSDLILGTATPTVTYDGNINSSGSLTKQGSGIFVLSADNTYSGGTTINAGEFTVTGSIVGPVLVNSSGTFNADNSFTITDFTGAAGSQANISTGNTLTFGTANSTDFAGVIGGSGNLTKQGTGTFTVSGNNTFDGVFNVNEGTLNMGGTLPAASTTIIASPATLAGIGSLGVVNLSGTLSPGNSIGTINAVDFTFNTGSNFLLEVSNTASDQLIATGTVTIDPGATVTVAGLGLSSPLAQYTIITSGSPLVGTGNFTLINSPLFNFSLSYDANHVFLILQSINQLQLDLSCATGNAKAVGKAFNAMLLTNPTAPGLEEVFGVLSSQTCSQLAKSLNQMQPANMDTIAFAQENVGELIRRTFTTRLFQQSMEACPGYDPYRVWIVPFIGHAHQDGRGHLSGYRGDTRGLTTGFDYQFQKHWAISTGFSVANTDVSMTSSRAHGNFMTYAGTVAGIWQDSNVYVDGLFSYYFNSVDAKRKMRFSAPGVSTVQRKAKHDNDVNAVMAHMGSGYDHQVKVSDNVTMNIYPFVSVDYFFLMQERYTEKKAEALDLVVYSKDYDLLRPEAGIGFGAGGCFSSVNFNIDFTASYIREQRFLGKKTKARFKHGEKNFTVRGLNPRNNLFGMGGNVTVGSINNSNVSVSLGYYGEFGSRFIENSGEVEVRVAF